MIFDKKTNRYLDWVSLGPLRSSVVLMIGERSPDLLYENKDIVNPLLTDSTINEIKCCISDGMYPGNKGLEFDVDGNFYIYMPKWSMEVFIHEAYHVTINKLKMANISDSDGGEVGARIIEYLYIRFIEGIEKCHFKKIDSIERKRKQK